MPKLVAAAVTLRSQIDKRFPKRDKRSDGWIGDKAHQARISDHNPDAAGWVHAIDIDADLGKPGDAQRLANEIVAYAASGLPGSNRIRYVVFNDQVASGTYAKTRWQWRGRGYGHRDHIHVSFLKAAEKDGSPFPLPIFGKA
jgi:hypothetical protein